MGILSDEELSRSSCRMRDAAESMARSADRMEEVAQKLTVLLGEGYGNNVSKLLQHLEEPTPQVFKQEYLCTPSETPHPAYLTYARLFVTLTDAFEEQFERLGLHRVMEASSAQLLRRHADTIDAEFLNELRKVVPPEEFDVTIWRKYKRTEQEIRERNATNKRRSLTVPVDP